MATVSWNSLIGSFYCPINPFMTFNCPNARPSTTADTWANFCLLTSEALHWSLTGLRWQPPLAYVDRLLRLSRLSRRETRMPAARFSCCPNSPPLSISPRIEAPWRTRLLSTRSRSVSLLSSPRPTMLIDSSRLSRLSKSRLSRTPKPLSRLLIWNWRISLPPSRTLRMLAHSRTLLWCVFTVVSLQNHY